MRVDFLESFSFATNFLEMWSYLSFSLITTSKSFFNNAKIITLHYSTFRIVIFSSLFHASWNFHQRNLINLNDEDENFFYKYFSSSFFFSFTLQKEYRKTNSIQTKTDKRMRRAILFLINRLRYGHSISGWLISWLARVHDETRGRKSQPFCSVKESYRTQIEAIPKCDLLLNGTAVPHHLIH